MKRVIQTYKPAGQWQNSPPGIGDFIRGLCHLYELGQQMGFEVRVDISQTEFADLIEPNPALFLASNPEQVRDAFEFSGNVMGMGIHLDRFMEDDRQELHLNTNLGHWKRPALPDSVKHFVRPFYEFTDGISARPELALDRYCVLSIRCGDTFFGSMKSVETRTRKFVSRIIERNIRPQTSLPIIVMSDSLTLKRELARDAGFIASSDAAAHGSAGGALAVVKDLDLLAHSQTNYHINAWAPWWSGFSHYTSLIMDVPSVNFYRENMQQRLRRYFMGS